MSELILFVVVVVAAGYALRRVGVVKAEAARDLNQVVFYVTLPPLIFRALHQGELRWSFLAMPAVAWGITLAGLGLGWGLAKLLRLRREVAGAFILALTFGNTTFLGYPIVQGFFGDHHLTLAIFYDLLGATIAANTLGVLIAVSLGTGEEKASARGIARRLATFPPIWALVLAMALRGVALPQALGSLLDRVGQITVPLIMLSIGLSLEVRHWRAHWPLVALVAAGRLVVLPALVFGAVTLAGLPQDFVQAAVLEAAMPTMFFSLTLALLFGLRIDLMVNAIMVSTVASFATLPLWHRILMP